MADSEPPGGEFGWTRRRVVFLSVSAAALAFVLMLAGSAVVPFLLAILIAYVLTPLVALGERKLRMPRSLAIVVVYVLVLGLAYLSIAGLAPRLYKDTVRFAREAPATIRGAADRYGPSIERWVRAYTGEEPVGDDTERPEPTLRAKEGPDGSLAIDLTGGVDVIQEGQGRWRIMPREKMRTEEFSVTRLVDEGLDRFVKYVQINAIEFLKVGQRMLADFARSVFLLFMVLMVAGYLMHTRESVLGFFRSLLPPAHRHGFDHLLVRLDRGLSGVVRGQLLICVVNGCLSAVGFWFFDLKYWPLLSLVAGVMSIIPIFGAILSTIPAVLVALTQDIWTALGVLAWIVGIHQLEANLLNPKIIGVSAKIHPVLIVFSLLVGEHLFGLWGAILAVPALSIVQSIFNHFRFTLPNSGRDSLTADELAKAGQRGV